jgi:hypothetical protein
MAKKRRKPNNRPRAPQPRGTSTKTSERPSGTEPASEVEPASRPGQGPSRTRAEKKELARAQREAARRRVARAGRARRIAWAGGIGILVAVGVMLLTRDSSTNAPAGPLPGELATEAPWPANADQAQERADAIGLPPEGSTMHIHSNLQIFVHGQPVAVPTDIGIDSSSDPATVESLHTHEDSGTIHMESSVQRTFTLGEFFDIWGVRLSPSCMGGYCNDAANTLQVFVDGQEMTGDPQEVALGDQQVVVVTYGTADELPDPIPATFDFSSIPQ